MIFDCLNEALDSRRVLGLKGSPLPVDMLKASGAWTSRQMNRPNDSDLAQVLKDTTSQISKWSSFLCGMFEYKAENLKYIGELESAPEVETMKEQRMNLLELAEMQEQAQKMNDCDDELYEISLLLNDAVFDHLLSDLVTDMKIISDIPKHHVSEKRRMTTTQMNNNTTQIPSEDIVTNLDCFANFSSSQTLKNPAIPEMHSSSQWPPQQRKFIALKEQHGPWTSTKPKQPVHGRPSGPVQKSLSRLERIDSHTDRQGSKTDRSRQSQFIEALKRNSLNEGTSRFGFPPEAEERDHNFQITDGTRRLTCDDEGGTKGKKFEIVVNKSLSLKIKQLKKISLGPTLVRQKDQKEQTLPQNKLQRMLTS